MWESLAIRLPWEQENAGSNPAIPTHSCCSFRFAVFFAITFLFAPRFGLCWPGPSVDGGSAGSSPDEFLGPASRRFRWSSCWYERPAVNREDAGSIPAAGVYSLRTLLEGPADRETAPGLNPGER